MAYKYVEKLIPSSKYSLKAPYAMTPQYVTIHNTSNDAPAANEVSYASGNTAPTGFHYAIDDKEAILMIPLNRTAFHAGDGASGAGNRKSIGIEICYSKSGGARYEAAEENAVYLAARLLYKYGLDISRLKKHQDWSGKYCPHRILDKKSWNDFKSRVNWVLEEIKAGRVNGSLTNGSTQPSGSAQSNTVNKPSAPVINESTSLTGSNFSVKIITDSLNIRKTASFNAPVVGTVGKGGVYAIVETSNGMGRLKSGTGWISMNTKYVEKVAAKPATTEYKVKVVNCDSLNVRSGAGASHKVVQTVKPGDVFTIVEEKDGWLKLKSGVGWISKAYTKKL